MFRLLAAAMLLVAAVPLAAIQKTADCRACHDGKKALQMDNGHPVGVDYAKARDAKPDHFKPAPTETLVDGKVECTSCHLGHDVDAPRQHRLRTDVITLCTSCHIVE